jgi:hypothetical protein
MDAQLDGTQTRGRKGLIYDWQFLLVPAEPEFSTSLNSLVNDQESLTGLVVDTH